MYLQLELTSKTYQKKLIFCWHLESHDKKEGFVSIIQCLDLTPKDPSPDPDPSQCFRNTGLKCLNQPFKIKVQS